MSTIRLTTILALALALTMLVALPSQTLARARSARCHAGASVHRAHGAHSCAASGHGARVKAKAGAKAKTKAKAHRHAAHHAKKGAGATKGAPGAPTSVIVQSPSQCEDGSAPVSQGHGVFACNDGSQPSCEDGSNPVAAKGGSKLVCRSAPSGGSAPAEGAGPEPLCEDGSFPGTTPSGAYYCDDSSEPSCEAGSAPVVSSDGSTVLCQVASDSEGEAQA